MNASKTYDLYLGAKGYGSIHRIEIYGPYYGPHDEERVVVVMTDHPENTGKSVTNAVEHIAAAVALSDDVEPGMAAWIEHYPQRGDVPESYDLVDLTWERHPRTGQLFARNPRWTRIDPEVAFGLMAGWVKLSDLDDDPVEDDWDIPEDAHLEAAYEDRFYIEDNTFDDMAYLDDYPPGLDDAFDIACEDW